MNIVPIFPELIGTVELGSEWAHIGKMLEGVDFQNQNGVLFSSSTYILNEQPFVEFKEELTRLANDYFSNVLCYKDSDLRMTQSWVTIKDPGHYHWPHVHPNSVVSGVYYWQDNIMPITFSKEGSSVLHIEQDEEKLKTNELAKSVLDFQVAKDTLVLFPSSLYHGVSKNMSSTPRYSLAFNMFPSYLGNSENFTELDLNKR